jgi:hypothetical protein
MDRRAPSSTETVSFSLESELVALLDAEAARLGVALPEYVRDAAMARAIAATMLSDGDRFERLACAVREVIAEVDDAADRRAGQLVLAALTRLAAAELREQTKAVIAQSEQAIRRTIELTD